MRESAIATPNVPAPGRRWTFLLNRAAGALAGGGDWRERLERRIAELGLQTRLHWLAPEEFPAMLRRCVDGEAPDVLAVGGG
ncbi:MAG TPA: hypothetical protein VNN09_11770, partial [Candidatus Competibacteraceae bacterium]|nr:hypothetical protein [Candidatus Competibacteraceae bacterium]